MVIDRIQYQKVFPIGSYATERIGLEASLDNGESPETALLKLMQITDELHKETMASMDEYRGTHVRVIDEVVDKTDGPLEAIRNCKTVEELKGFWLISKGNLTFSEAYKTKLKQLENANDQ